MHLLDLEEMKVLISVLDLFHIIHGDGIIILLLIMKLLVSLNNYMNISEYNHVTGVTPECNATLAAFACYESFHRCDEQGFYTGTCREACEAVTYECANLFETVDLEKYDCTSSRYLDGNAQTCTGNPAYANLEADHLFLAGEQDPIVLLYESSSASSMSVSIILSAFAIIFALMF